MLYLDESHIRQIGIDWRALIDVIEQAVKCLAAQDYSQPIKPYLRYRDPNNRIIAMPAFVGGNFDAAGIKWIASFPGNIHKGIPRAHSVVILNRADTGEPVAIINTALLSILRTASVSGLMMKHFDRVRPLRDIQLGIIGWGPIGQYHLKMCSHLFGSTISRVFLYDKRKIDLATVDSFAKDRVTIADSWQEAFRDADVFITCTAAQAPYIDQAPKKGSLQLNVSLRDYKVEIYEYVKDSIIVDDWQEVCREQTDVEKMHKEKGLSKDQTRSIVDVVVNDCLREYQSDVPVMFNPMGMAVFDIAMAAHYAKAAGRSAVGREL